MILKTKIGSVLKRTLTFVKLTPFTCLLFKLIKNEAPNDHIIYNLI